MEHSVENTYVAVENGEYVTKKEAFSLKAEPDHIIIKVAYSTCDPYDGICSHLFKSEGIRLGGEACGQIVSVGEGAPQDLLNKKVSFHKQGCWSNYVQIKASDPFIVLHDSQELKKAASSWINPLTVLGQLEILESRTSKTFVASAAASTLNKMLIKLVKEKGYEAICIVRREEQAKILREEFGVKHVFLQDSPTFEKDYKAVAAELKPAVFFDAVGGGAPTTVPVFESLQPGGIMTVIACLTGKPVPINTYDILFNDKTLNSYLVFPWALKLTPELRQKYFKQVADDLALNDGKIFGTHFTREIPLENWKEALEIYQDVASKEGAKVIIKCNP